MFLFQEQYFMGVVKFISLYSRGLHGSNQARLNVYSQHPAPIRSCLLIQVSEKKQYQWLGKLNSTRGLGACPGEGKVPWKTVLPFLWQLRRVEGRWAGGGHLSVTATSLISPPWPDRKRRGLTVCLSPWGWRHTAHPAAGLGMAFTTSFKDHERWSLNFQGFCEPVVQHGHD